MLCIEFKISEKDLSSNPPQNPKTKKIGLPPTPRNNPLSYSSNLINGKAIDLTADRDDDLGCCGMETLVLTADRDDDFGCCGMETESLDSPNCLASESSAVNKNSTDFLLSTRKGDGQFNQAPNSVNKNSTDFLLSTRKGDDQFNEAPNSISALESIGFFGEGQGSDGEIHANAEMTSGGVEMGNNYVLLLSGGFTLDQSRPYFNATNL